VSDSSSPPRENLIRAVMPGVELRSAEDGGDGKTLYGHFARFNEWTEINSVWEGRFMERFAPGSFKKTIRETRDRMRVLFQHGQDPEIGDKVIASINDLREDDEGAYYEARLFDGLSPLVLDGLRADQYGASFRFSSLREHVDQKPGESEYNPLGLPERTVKEARVPEFGPVTFPAYEGASAGVRSLTDEFLMRCFQRDPVRLREMFDRATELRADEPETQDDAPSTTDAAESTSGPERRVTASRRGPLALPTRTERDGLNLNTTKEAAWPFR
jgi:HK97 family phage prohead protease